MFNCTDICTGGPGNTGLIGCLKTICNLKKSAHKENGAYIMFPLIVGQENSAGARMLNLENIMLKIYKINNYVVKIRPVRMSHYHRLVCGV